MKKVLKKAWNNLSSMIMSYVTATHEASKEIVKDIKYGKFVEKGWHKHVPIAIICGVLAHLFIGPTFSSTYAIVEIFCLTFIAWILIWVFEGIQSMISGSIEKKRDSRERLKDVVISTLAFFVSLIVTMIFK